jgi:hypothetical protein
MPSIVDDEGDLAKRQMTRIEALISDLRWEGENVTNCIERIFGEVVALRKVNEEIGGKAYG